MFWIWKNGKGFIMEVFLFHHHDVDDGNDDDGHDENVLIRSNSV